MMKGGADVYHLTAIGQSLSGSMCLSLSDTSQFELWGSWQTSTKLTHKTRIQVAGPPVTYNGQVGLARVGKNLPR